MLMADNPITRHAEDTLGRSASASSFARHILSLDASEGAVVAVLGAWGSGKTSFVNLARADMVAAGVTVIDFNPWLVSGAEQLVNSFFAELVSQLKIKKTFEKIAETIQKYGEAFSGVSTVPVVGQYINIVLFLPRLMKLLSQKRDGEGITTLRDKVRTALGKLSAPIVVVLDDIDRLPSQEIRDVFKLVRLTASFPQIIYLLAFDRTQVEKALNDQGIPGRSYLEKIIQLAVDLPALSDDLLTSQITGAIDTALSGIQSPGPFDSDVWPDIFMEIVYPLVRNLRDVRRYAMALSGTLRDLDGQVSLVDVLALEAIRILLPDVFCLLQPSAHALTAISGLGISHVGEKPAPDIDMLIQAGSEHRDVVKAMIRRLFPAAEHLIGGSHYGAEWQAGWLRDRRVAHEAILSYYLQRTPDEKLRAFTDAERAWAVMGDRTRFEQYMQSLDPKELEGVVEALLAFEDMYTHEHVVPGAIVLLNLMSSIPERPLGMFDFDARIVVGRTVYRLLRQLGDPSSVEQAVRAILPELSSLSASLELLSMVGYRAGAGHKLVSESAAAGLEAVWRGQVRSASPQALIGENDLLRVLSRANEDSVPGEPDLHIPDVPELTLAILHAAKSEVRSQSMGNRAVRRSPRLAWDALIQIYGTEPQLKESIDHSRAIGSGHEELLSLVDKYLGGWRPEE